MLPNHAPLKVAEVFRTLSALHPGRIDLGLGRAPGSDGLASRALRAGDGHEFPAQLAELLAFGGSQMQPGQAGFPLAINLNAQLLGNQKDGVFTATAVYVKKGKRLRVVRTTVTGAEGRLIAEVTTSHVPAG